MGSARPEPPSVGISSPHWHRKLDRKCPHLLVSRAGSPYCPADLARSVIPHTLASMAIELRRLAQALGPTQECRVGPFATRMSLSEVHTQIFWGNPGEPAHPSGFPDTSPRIGGWYASEVLANLRLWLAGASPDQLPCDLKSTSPSRPLLRVHIHIPFLLQSVHESCSTF